MPQSVGGHEAAIAHAKTQIPPLERLFAPGAALALPQTAYGEAELHETDGFADRRLVLHTGTSRLEKVTVGWCLFGATRNVRGSYPALSAAVREALDHPGAARALDLLAVDHRETDEAAVEALAEPGAAEALVRLGAAAHQQHDDRAPMHADLGTWIYAAHTGPFDLGGVTTDIVCIGSPIWIVRDTDLGVDP